MPAYEITHIKKPNRNSPVESIQEVAGPDFKPATLAAAVAWAETPGNRFFVRGSMGATVDVRVMQPRTPQGSKFLQTVADRTETNNLLHLPEITTVMYARG